MCVYMNNPRKAQKRFNGGENMGKYRKIPKISRGLIFFKGPF